VFVVNRVTSWLSGVLGLARRSDPVARRAPPLSFARAPRDWDDVAGWDAHWRSAIALADAEAKQDGLPVEEERGGQVLLEGRGSDLHPMGDQILVMWLAEQAPTGRILVVGNGISLMPRALAHLGWTVVALDISPVATAYARAYAPRACQLQYFFQRHGGGARRASAVHRPGGRVDYVAGSLFDASLAPGPFDLIIAHRSLQGFTGSRLAEAVDAIDARLTHDGRVKCGVQNDRRALHELRSLFRARGYRCSGETTGGPKRLDAAVFSG
jgi:hypothetical protein